MTLLIGRFPALLKEGQEGRCSKVRGLGPESMLYGRVLLVGSSRPVEALDGIAVPRSELSGRPVEVLFCRFDVVVAAVVQELLFDLIEPNNAAQALRQEKLKQWSTVYPRCLAQKCVK